MLDSSLKAPAFTRPIIKPRVEVKRKKVQAIPDLPIPQNLPTPPNPLRKAQVLPRIRHHHLLLPQPRKNPKDLLVPIKPKDKLCPILNPIMATTVLTLVADGFEEIEATAPINLLRRAEAVVTVASCSESLEVTGRSKITLRADTLLSQVPAPLAFDLLVLPGGPAVFELRKQAEIIDLIKSFAYANKPIGAICAAPLLLLDAGLLTTDSNCTAHESTSNELANIQPNDAVIKEGKIITSRGAGTAVEFGLTLINYLFGPDKENEIRSSIHADLS